MCFFNKVLSIRKTHNKQAMHTRVLASFNNTIVAAKICTHLQCGGRLLRGVEASLRQGWLWLLVEGGGWLYCLHILQARPEMSQVQCASLPTDTHTMYHQSTHRHSHRVSSVCPQTLTLSPCLISLPTLQHCSRKSWNIPRSVCTSLLSDGPSAKLTNVYLLRSHQFHSRIRHFV